MKRKFQSALIIIALLALFLWASKDVIHHPGIDRGMELHYSVRRFLKTHLEGRTAFSLSQPTIDPDAGWQQIVGNNWRLFGFIIRTNKQTIPWAAEVSDGRTEPQSSLHRLEIGGVAVITNGQLAVSSNWFQPKSVKLN